MKYGWFQLVNNGNPVRSNVCSPSTSEIGSVFGLRFDPQENKMTLQLTAAPTVAPPLAPPPPPPSSGPAVPSGPAVGGESAMDVSPEAFQVSANFTNQLQSSLMNCR